MLLKEAAFPLSLNEAGDTNLEQSASASPRVLRQAWAGWASRTLTDLGKGIPETKAETASAT